MASPRIFVNGIQDPRNPGSSRALVSDASGNGTWQALTSANITDFGSAAASAIGDLDVYDSFVRTVVNGWGSANTGQAWAIGAGLTTDYNVSAGVGTMANVANGDRRISLDSGSVDQDMYADCTFASTVTGAAVNPVIYARADNVVPNNAYRVVLTLTTTGTFGADLQKWVAGAGTNLVAGFVSGLTFTPGAFIRTRLQVIGTSVRAKVWLATAAEPSIWQAAVTDSSVTTGTRSLMESFVGPGSTSSSLVTSWDNLHVFTSSDAVVNIAANAVENRQLYPMAANTIKGNNTGSTATPIDLTVAQLNAMGVGGGGLTGWVDVTKFAGTPVLSSNTAAQNITAINAILAASAAGSTIYFPGGSYNFNAAWTMPAGKQFTFQGQGMGLSGGNTLLLWTSNVAATWIVLASSTFYYHFRDLNFVSSGVTQTAGAVIDVNGNATTNFTNCTFSGLSGGLLNDVLVGTATGFNQSWNTSVISSCIMNSYKGRGIFIDSAAASLVVTNCVIQGQWGTTGGTPASAMALAGIEAGNCGALQINDCDVLGNINNLLMDPGAGKVCASVFCTNTYFDNSGGSCIKIAGAGATVRARFDTCSFTTAGTNFTTAGTALSAFEIAGTFAFTATAGQGINLINCNILNTFSTTGTTNALLVTGAADFSVAYCNIAAYTNGLNVTPIATANVTKFNFSNNTVGVAGGYSGVSTGVLVNAGAASYKTYTISDNDFNGCTTAITDTGAISAFGGNKQINNNAGTALNLRTNLAQSATYTTSEIIMGRIWCEPNTLKNGTLIRVQIISGISASGTTTARIRIGTTGGTGDLAVVTAGPGTLSGAAAAVNINMLSCVAAVGVSATHIGGGTIANAAVASVTNPVPAASGTFNSTVGNWISVGVLCSAGTSTLRAGILEVLAPS